MTSSLDLPWRRDARRGDDRETMRETKREQSETGDGAARAFAVRRSTTDAIDARAMT